MRPITAFVKRHQLIVFFGLAYARSWAPSPTEPHGILPLGPYLSTGRSLLLGSLLLGVLHALWHLPLFGLEYTWQNGLARFIGLLGYTLAATFVYQHTEGNLLLPALFRASVNTTATYLFGPLFSGADTIQLWWLWGALWCGAATIILVESRWRQERPISAAQAVQ